jgi:arylsulfatase A-like enzyme
MFWERRADRAVRMGNWKWLKTGNASGLYDVAADIGEKTDLSKQRPEIVQQLQARFAAWKAEMEAAEPRGPFRDY